MKVLLILLIATSSFARDFRLNLYKVPSTSQAHEGDNLLSDRSDYQKRAVGGYRKGTFYYWGEESDCQLEKVGDLTAYEFAKSFIVNFSFDDKEMLKLLDEPRSPLIDTKQVSYYKCDKKYALDFMSFDFASERTRGATVIIEYLKNNGRILDLSKEFGGIDRFYEWEKDHPSDLSIAIGNLLNQGQADKLKKNNTFLVPFASHVKSLSSEGPPLLVSNFQVIGKGKHHSYIKYRKDGVVYSLIGISEIMETANEIPHLELLKTIEKLVVKLRKSSDVIIIAGSMSDRVFKEVRKSGGVDLVIYLDYNHEFLKRPTKMITFISRKNNLSRGPVVEIPVDWRGATALSITPHKGKLVLKVEYDLLDDRYAAYENYFKGFYALGDDHVLPPRKELNPKKLKYSEEEIAYLIANVLVKSEQVDVAVVYPYKKNTETIGAVSSIVMKEWIPRNEKWVRGFIWGSDILGAKGYLFGGMKDNQINGVPILPDFRYSALVPQSRLDDFKTFKKNDLAAESVEDKVIKRLSLMNKTEIEHLMVAFQDSSKMQWSFYLDKMALEFSTLSRRNGSSFASVPNSELQNPTSTLLGIDISSKVRLDYKSSISTLGVSGLYKRSKITETGISQINVLEDDFKVWLTQGFPWFYSDSVGKHGPYVQAIFDSEFSPTVSREKIFNGQIGWKIFDGKYLSGVSVAPFWESDLSNERSQFGWEVEVSIKHQLKHGIIQGKSSLKYYFNRDDTTSQDLKHLYRLEVSYANKLFGNLSLAPFFKFLHYKNRYSGVSGQQQMVGVKLSYDDLWRL